MVNRKYLIPATLSCLISSCAGQENVYDANVGDSPSNEVSVKEMPRDQYGLGVPLQYVIDGDNALELCINLTRDANSIHWMYGGGVFENWEYSFHYLDLGSSGYRDYEMAKENFRGNFGDPSLKQLINDVENQIETYKVTGLVIHDHDLSYKEKRNFVEEMEDIDIPVAFYSSPRDLEGPWD